MSRASPRLTAANFFSGRSTAVECNGRFDDLSATVRVDVDALAPVTSHHDDFGSEARTFDVKLEAIALRIADGRTAGAAAAFSPAPTDLILVIDCELTDEIEIVAVTCTAKLEIDFALRTAWAVSGVATDTLGGPVFRP